MTGKIRLPNEFSSGVAPGQAVYVLRSLGFTVVQKGEKVEADDDRQGKNWSEQEVRLIVADYFGMLERELLGKAFSKAEHRRGLGPRLVSCLVFFWKHGWPFGVRTQQSTPGRVWKPEASSFSYTVCLRVYPKTLPNP